MRLWIAIGAVALASAPAVLWFERELARQSDAALRDLASALPMECTPSKAGEAPPFDGAMQIQTWDASRRPGCGRSGGEPGLALQPPGYSTVAAADRRWRVYCMARDDGFVQVARPLSAYAAARTVVPALLLSSVVALLAGILVGRSRPAGRAGTPVGREPVAVSPGPPAPSAATRTPEPGLEARIERALTAQRDYLGDAAHELRSPLTALKLQIQLARRAESDAAREAAFRKVDERLDRCTRLVNQLLTLSRHEAHVARPKPVPVDLMAAARTVVADHLAQAEARGIDLGIRGEDDPIVVRGYPEGIRVMLGNLVDNALRYTPRGGAVDVVVERRGDGVSAAVADTGPGIPEESRARIFDRFFRVTGTTEPGSGLGLAIVRSIAEYHGAVVALGDDAARGGLAVRIDFPDR
jgi:two-component system, OmpR family, sensor kinase